ncbi:hypothetical protein [Acholeplasma laidlawii]|uniref:hypothetical protein n=1 Tax=Acholeplasma laidlawii TaxID=2148 RepID=UPI0018C1F868|nr:hypothetical protein [Acholeplasma laidlawii]
MHWNLICSFMDRIDDSLNALITKDYLSDTIGTTDDLILFLIHTDIIVEAIKKLYSRLGLTYPLKEDNSIFNQIGKGRGTDDRFFRHIRALSFAHSVETANPSPYVQEGEIQYSPFIINGATLNSDKVIIRVYTSLSDEYDSLRIPKRQFINYIDEILYVLNYQSDNEKNDNAVQTLKTYIMDNLNDFISLYQSMDESYYSYSFMNALSFNWNTDYQSAHYALEKIRSYLNEEIYGPNNYCFDDRTPYNPDTLSNVEWGFQHLKIFKELLANMYVDIL